MIIGLTGSIATGKSTVTKYLLSKGYPVIDSDLLARQVVEKGHPVLENITKEFGGEVLLESGELNRKALGAIVFSDEQARKKLNALTHPAINEQMHRLIEMYENDGHQYIFCDIPLLYEGRLESTFDEVWVVYIPENLQLERLMNRDAISADEAKGKIAAQLSIEDKKQRATHVIDNSKSKELTYEQIDRLLG